MNLFKNNKIMKKNSFKQQFFISLSYVLLAYLSIQFSKTTTINLSYFYPSVGIAIGSFIVWKKGAIPALLAAFILVAAFSNYQAEYFLLLSVIDVFARILELMIAILLINKFIGANIAVKITEYKAFLVFSSIALFAGGLHPALTQLLSFHINPLTLYQTLYAIFHTWMGNAIGIILITPLFLTFAQLSSTPSELPPKEKLHKIHLIVFLLIFFIYAFASLYLLNISQHREIERILGDKSDKIVNKIEDVIQDAANNSRIIAELIAKDKEITQSSFELLVTPFINDQSWSSISWNPMVFDKQAYESLSLNNIPNIIFEKNNNGDIVPAKNRAWYSPVRYIVPLKENESAIGYNIASNTLRLDAINYALTYNNTANTKVISLIQSNDNGILFIHPVSDKSHQPQLKHNEVYGFIVGVLSLDDMFHSTFLGVPEKEYSYEIVDEVSNIIYQQGEIAEFNKGQQSRKINLLGQYLTLFVQIENEHYYQSLPTFSWFLPFINLLVLIFVTCLLLYKHGQESLIQTIVHNQTRKLKNIQEIHKSFILESNTNKVFDKLLAVFLSQSNSEYGFIGRVFLKQDGSPYLKTLSITNIAWNDETRAFYDEKIIDGIEFSNLDTLFGAVLKTGALVISNDPKNDPRSAGVPKDHPPLKSFLGIPIKKDNALIGMVGIANSPSQYHEKLLIEYDLLIDATINIIYAIQERDTKLLALEEIKRANKSIKEEQERLTMQGDIISQITTNTHVIKGDWDSAITFISQILSNLFNVERVSIWLLSENKLLLTCNSLFSKSTDEHTFGQVLEVYNFPIYFETLLTKGILNSTHAQLDATTAEFVESYLTPLNIQSMLDVCIRKDGAIKGIICVESVGEIRDWSKDECNFLNTVSSILSQLLYTKERNQIQSNIVQEQHEKALIVDKIQDGIITIDDKGTILSFNNEASKIFGYSQEEIISQNVEKLMPQKFSKKRLSIVNSYLIGVSKVINGKREVEAVKVNGDTFPVRLSVTELTINNRVKRFLVTIHDLTIEKQQEKYLQHTQKMEALGQLTGGVAHDFNNLLGIILGYSELIQNKADGQISKYVKQVIDASERASDLTKQLLSFASKESISTSSIHLNNLLIDKRSMFEKVLATQISIQYNLMSNLPEINVNQSELESAILNLIINAKHAMNHKGSLKISTNLVSLDNHAIYIFNPTQSNYVCLAIEDEGKGMNKQVLNRLFEPFFTTKGSEGTGLGLAQVYGFVQRIEGNISVKSEINKGTTFELYFPLSQSKQIIERVEDDNIHVIKNKHILIVDDEKPLQELYQNELMQAGYTVSIAGSVDEAIVLLNKQPFDILLTDILMPIKNGVELSQYVISHYPEIKIQLMSGYSEKIDISQIPKTLYDSRLKKPFKIKTLITVIGKLIQE